MSRTTFKLFILSSWRGHVPFCLTALLACMPFLWGVEETEVMETVCAYSAGILFVAFHISAVLMVVSCVYLTLHLRNLRAFGHLLAWALLWAGTWCVFALFSIIANVPPPQKKDVPQPIQETDTLYLPDEHLLGPFSLVIHISTDGVGSETLATVPSLAKLVRENDDLLTDFLTHYPSRWAAADTSDTFYMRHGHVVLQLPSEEGESPQLVHAIFRTFVGGDALPEGYAVVNPGDPFPTGTHGGKHSSPTDIALNLGKQHYLLLACRGIAPGEPTRKAINAAIATVDECFQQLAKSPTHESLLKMIEGKPSIAGDTPGLRVCEPTAQFGVYQAEIYANPGAPGTLVVFIRDLESHTTLRLFNCTAKYSANQNELFRHDIPASSPPWMQETSTSKIATLFPMNCPIFAIAPGTPHRYFGVEFKVEFVPADGSAHKVLLRRCYRVQPFMEVPPTPPKHTDIPAPEEVTDPAASTQEEPEPAVEPEDEETPDDIEDISIGEIPTVVTPHQEPEEPTVEPEPQPTPVEEPTIEPEPQPVPVEEPTVEPEPQPAPVEEPAVEPEPQPAPVEEPAVEPEPQPEPAEEPAMEPEPQPAPVEGPASGDDKVDGEECEKDGENEIHN